MTPGAVRWSAWLGGIWLRLRQWFALRVEWTEEDNEEMSKLSQRYAKSLQSRREARWRETGIQKLIETVRQAERRNEKTRD